MFYIANIDKRYQDLTGALCAQFEITARTLWKYINELRRHNILNIQPLRDTRGKITGSYLVRIKTPDGGNLHECAFFNPARRDHRS
ncbi:hypothetical protein ASB1_05230 [Helicobacter heilmannii]|nr:hypothetical protein ASB1_05230 [Helicobacter heilmannii]